MPVIWSLIGLMVASAVALSLAYSWLWGETPRALAPWWALAIGFAISGAFVIHLPIRRDAHSLSMSEVLLVLGLGLASPVALITARLAGAFVALSLVRRQPPSKLGFNLSLAYLETVVTVIVYRLILGDALPVSPLGWAAAVAAVMAGLMVGWTMVTLVISVHDRQPTARELRQSMGVAVVTAMASALIGIVFLVSLWTDPQSIWLVAVLIALVYSFTGAYGALTKRYNDLQSVFAFSSEVHRPLHRDDVLATSLRQIRQLMRSDHADMVLQAEGGWHRVSMGPDGSMTARTVDPAQAADTVRLVLSNPDRRWFSRTRGRSRLREFYADAGFDSGIVSTLSGDDDVIGLIGAGNRLGPVSSFDADDRKLLDVLAKQTSDTLARSALVERLKDELEQREQHAEELVRAKDEFLASVSHELRTPITAVLGSAELLTEQIDELDREGLEELTGYIAREGREISHLIDDLLIATKADLGRLAIKVETIDVRLEAMRAIASVQSVAQGRAVEAGGLGGEALADPLRFRQIIRNLLANALRYGGPEVSVESSTTATTHTVRVIDNGSGIPVGERAGVFAPYGRAHEDTGVTDSVGLGLTVARRLAESMSGTLRYDYVGGRSVFSLELPAVPTH